MTTAEPLNPELTLATRVAEVIDLGSDIRGFRLELPGATLPPFTPGAHILVQTPMGATRRYSLANAPDDEGGWLIAVKHERGGRGGSASMCDHLAVGDTLHVSPPRNEFELRESAPGYVFIAGGIGITPLRAMARHVAQTTAKPWKLYYLTRDPASTAWRDEFLSDEFRGNVILHHDHGDLARSYDLWPVLEKPKSVHLYCCGPKGLMDAVRDMSGHWPTHAVHFEDFVSAPVAHPAEDKPFVVRVGEGGAPIEVPADGTILESLRAHGVRVPSSCESGTCGSCRLKLLAGEAEHRDLVLTEAERCNHVIACVSRARSPELVVDL